ncbi:MAG: glycosyltransferase [Planctomycetota bacterium]
MTSAGRNSVDVSILVTTYRRPRHLGLALESIARQRLDTTTIEVVVSDDGSDDETAEVVSRFAARSGIATRFVSQPHDGFRLARARNAAARLARGSYLVFLDGDCMIPPHHVASHVARRRPGTALLGYCARLTEPASRTLCPEELAAVDLDGLVPSAERRLLGRRHRKAWWRTALRHPTKPRLAGGDFGVWRDDFVAVNGFDEQFVGWGQEDDDLGLRLRAAGVRLESILDQTRSLHVWHPSDPTATRRWRDGPNVPRLARRGRLIACRSGIMERPSRSLVWGLPTTQGLDPTGQAAAAHLSAAATVPPGRPCEIEVAIATQPVRFARPAECRLLLVPVGHTPDPRSVAAADQVAEVTDAASVRRALDVAG